MCLTLLEINLFIYYKYSKQYPPPLNMASKTGYQCNFVSEPDDALKCLICLAVARDPWQHGKYDRLFCEKCLNEYGKDKPCPSCKMKYPMYMEDARSK